MPQDRLAKINQIYKGSRQGLETYLNEGIQNPESQLESVSDYNPAELKANIVKKLMGDTIPNAMRANPSSSAAIQTTLSNYLDSAKKQEGSLNKIIQDIAGEEAYGATIPINTKGMVTQGTIDPNSKANDLSKVYGESKINYNVPSSIQKIEDAGTRMAVTGTTGSHYHGENAPVTKLAGIAMNPVGGTGSAIASVPYKVANVMGKAASPYRAVADKLMEGPFKAVGQAMHDQLDNPTKNGMNALMMKIMQNPMMKEHLGINAKNPQIEGVVNSDQENK